MTTKLAEAINEIFKKKKPIQKRTTIYFDDHKLYTQLKEIATREEVSMNKLIVYILLQFISLNK